jgi:hypothetical protein
LGPAVAALIAFLLARLLANVRYGRTLSLVVVVLLAAANVILADSLRYFTPLA